MQYISEIERGNKLPSLTALTALSEAYGLLVTDLLVDMYPFGSKRRPRTRVRPPQDGRSHRA